ncbi:MAG: lipid IV(A) 3-deoxy-D-manno-octulosonic acid transferase [Candidatus Parabeggiatoa sp.]|nr:lipid IV(A) 3-deoxy-D-manno-octulosonic acid transferase [Candidatus Parabeggiatoa sp.]
MRLLYTFLFYLFVPFILLRLLWRGMRARGYWQRWGERFGFFPALPVSQCLWIHAVSMGEVQAAVPLIQALLIRFPEQAVLVTTMTPTGSQRVREVLGDKVWHVYLPYDLPGAVARFLNRTQPRLLILMETELWPNVLLACQARAIPVILANARLSVGSAAGYQRIAGLTRTMLAGVTTVAVQTSVDAARFIELGVPATKVQVTGSIKFDTRLPADVFEKALVLRRQWGTDRLVWIAASTHEGEEEAVLAAFSELRASEDANLRNLVLVLVPRHPERFNRVAALCRRRGWVTVRRAEGELCTAETAVYLGDTMGELPVLYAACDVAFVGGSLVPIGCHNLLEPAAVALPVIMGPHVFECAEICRRLLEAQAAQQVDNAGQLAVAVKRYLSDATLRLETGEKGRLFVQQNRGALQRLLAIIDET